MFTASLLLHQPGLPPQAKVHSAMLLQKTGFSGNHYLYVLKTFATKMGCNYHRYTRTGTFPGTFS